MRNKVFITSVLLAAALMTSCHEKEPIEDNSAREEAFGKIAEAFLDNTVYPTYAALADNTEALLASIEDLAADKTQAKLNAVCTRFLDARAQWELSEAFLFGAATDFGIDPHIDSWPLDEDSFNDLMASPNILKNLQGEGGAEYAGAKLGNELLGFHGIEYILFEDGKSKDVSKISDDAMIYAIAVAGDLRNRTAQLDVAWRGNKAPAARTEMMEDLELQVTVSGGDSSYGENLLNAGKAGSTFYSRTHAMQSILSACSNIIDEVGTSKIGKAHNGEDVSYIESPYSYNSITDFYDNITSVENVYYGGVAGKRDESKSLHAYLKENNPEIDRAVTAALGEALAKIKAMKAPFVLNYTDKSAKEAIQACAELDECIGKAITAIAQ